jgi:hypothetical protein
MFGSFGMRHQQSRHEQAKGNRQKVAVHFCNDFGRVGKAGVKA